jgi:hypothetical protein
LSALHVQRTVCSRFEMKTTTNFSLLIFSFLSYTTILFLLLFYLLYRLLLEMTSAIGSTMAFMQQRM